MGINRRTMLAGAGALALPRIDLVGGAAQVKPSVQGLIDSYQVPDWYRDAKLGLWAHWGPQCAPEAGDWYGRRMYLEGEPQGVSHRARYGHPADHGFIDIIADWKAKRWNPETVVSAYKAAGARFVVAMACHHDNFDLFASSHHPWNSTRVGPRRDLVGGWERAVRRAGLRFGVSNHASHAWHWWQTAYGYDTQGPRKGERYDAWRLTTADGRGKPWQGLDPQQLYTGRRGAPPDGISSPEEMIRFHDALSGPWPETMPPQGPAFAMNWLARQIELVERYAPDFVYQDGHTLPFGNIGVTAAAHFYNHVLQRTGKFDGVMTAGPPTGQGTLPTLERKIADGIRAEPWQTATCIGDWHYNRARFLEKSYLPVREVIRQLADVVAKNGTLLLSIPVRGDGTLDSEEQAILATLGRWMALEGEAAIYSSRPWRVHGEDDVRYTVKQGRLNALLLDPKAGQLALAALGKRLAQGGTVERVRLIGGGPVNFRQSDDALVVEVGADIARRDIPVLAIEGAGLT